MLPKLVFLQRIDLKHFSTTATKKLDFSTQKQRIDNANKEQYLFFQSAARRLNDVMLSVSMSVCIYVHLSYFCIVLERGFKIANIKAQIEFHPFFYKNFTSKISPLFWVEFHPLFELNFASFLSWISPLFWLNLRERSNITLFSEANLRLVNLPLKKGQIEYSICLRKMVRMTDP